MARNTEKNRYIPVPLARSGKTLERLQADAAIVEMEDALGKLIALRVGEYYEALYEGRILPKGLVYNGVSVVQVSPAASMAMGAMGSVPRPAPALPLAPPNTPATGTALLQQAAPPAQDSGSKVIEFATSLDEDMSFFAEEDE